MSMILFKYKPTSSMMQLINEQIVDHQDGYVNGIMEEAIRYQLKKMEEEHSGCKLYLVCESNDTDLGQRYYKKPYAVVAISDYDAVRIYNEFTDKDGSVLGILEDKASRANVEF